MATAPWTTLKFPHSYRQAPSRWPHLLYSWLPVLVCASIFAIESTAAFGANRTSVPLYAACHAIFYVEVPPGASVGEHPHRSDSEEYYLILSGSGRLRLGDETLDVAAGDLIRNDPGQTHGLVNTGPEPLRFFVFDAETRSS